MTENIISLIVIDDKLRGVIDTSQQGQFINKNTFYHGQLISSTLIVNNKLFVDKSYQGLLADKLSRFKTAFHGILYN